jgi:hypothetical protein
MGIEDEVERYVQDAITVRDEIGIALSDKEQALRDRDFFEVYRLAGVITYLAQKSEEIDRKWFISYGKGG